MGVGGAASDRGRGGSESVEGAAEKRFQKWIHTAMAAGEEEKEEEEEEEEEQQQQQQQDSVAPSDSRSGPQEHFPRPPHPRRRCGRTRHLSKVSHCYRGKPQTHRQPRRRFPGRPRRRDLTPLSTSRPQKEAPAPSASSSSPSYSPFLSVAKPQAEEDDVTSRGAGQSASVEDKIEQETKRRKKRERRRKQAVRGT